MKKHLLYTSHAELYDAIYHFKPYEAEAERLHDILERHNVKDGSSVLEAACGTGNYLQHLHIWYRVAGFDRYGEILMVARRKLPQADLFVADMARFSVGHRYDAILCLFSSIGYLLTRDRLEAAAGCFARALRPGGILLVEPFLSPKEYAPGRLVLQSYDGEKLKCTRACIPGLEGDRAMLDYHWLILRSGQTAVEHFVERHELWLCPRELMTKILEQAGFSVSTAAQGLVPNRDLFIAERREGQ